MAVQHFLVIPAAGSGRRMQQALPKQYLPVLGKPLLHRRYLAGRAA